MADLLDDLKYREGIALFNAKKFYDAHEVLEDVWRESPGREKPFLQAIIQVAVALHHYSTANLVGARSLLTRAARNLAGYPDEYGGINLAMLRASLAGWCVALESGAAPPSLPTFDAQRAGVKLAPPVNHSTIGRGSALAASQTAVPQLDLQRQYADVREEVLAAIERVCRSQQFIQGEEVKAFERDAAAYLGVGEVVGCASGTDALWLALVAAGAKPGDEVITTPFSFFASAGAIVRAGARPIFVDIEPHTLNLDTARVEQRLRQSYPARLAAILPVHLYGQCADMDALDRISREFRVPMLEDAAQAFGAAWRGKRAGSLGSAAAFSFYPTKNLSAYGDAGCVATNDLRLAAQVRLLANHGSRERYFHEEIGANSRLDAVQAAVLRVKMKHLERWNAHRREHAAIYDALFAEAGLVSRSATPSPVCLLATAPEAFHIFHQYVIRAWRRDELRQFLSARGIGTRIYYPVPLHLQPAFSYLGYSAGDLPKAERAAAEVLALPMFPELTQDEQRRVVAAVAEFYS
jgi:dTDP-4-amino-4,6-dideoxygalactose transaminase/predicted metal-dependent hydrolase